MTQMQSERRLSIKLLQHFLIFLFLAGCVYFPTAHTESVPTALMPDGPQAQTSPTLEVSTLTLPSPQINSKKTVDNSLPTKQRTKYELTAILDYAMHHLSVSEIITYTNHTSVSLDEIILMVDANRYQDVFKLNRIGLIDAPPLDSYELDGNQLHLTLPTPLAANELVVLSIEYELLLPSPSPKPLSRPVPFGYTSRQANLVDWYPFIAPYSEGKGWLAHQAGFFGEHLVYESSDFVVHIQTPGYKPLDVLADPTIEPERNLIIAASSLPTISEDWYHYQFKNARTFAWSASPLYLITRDKITNVEVIGYAFPTHREAGETSLKVTASALDLYNKLFGNYQHNSLSVVEADFLDGMEYDGLYFLSNGFYNLHTGSPAEYITAIAAHETAHQWWYGIVGNDQAMDPWMDEALCTYSEYLFYENLHPEALDWWWQYRINYYEPKGWINGSIYSYTYTTDAYRAYRDAVYLNGALFLEDLRKLMGDQALFAFLRDYVEQTKNQISTPENFFMLIKQQTNKDLTPLIKKYFYELNLD